MFSNNQPCSNHWIFSFSMNVNNIWVSAHSIHTQMWLKKTHIHLLKMIFIRVTLSESDIKVSKCFLCNKCHDIRELLCKKSDKLVFVFLICLVLGEFWTVRNSHLPLSLAAASRSVCPFSLCKKASFVGVSRSLWLWGY